MIVSLFPSPVLHSEMNLDPSMLEWVKKYYQDGQHESSSSSVGWHSKYTLHEDQRFLGHSILIYSHIQESLSRLTDAPFYINSMWASVNKPGDYNNSHIHAGVDFSGVLYLQAPVLSGHIIFENENAKFRYNWKLPEQVKDDLSLHDSCWFYPSAGRCLIFPADLRHRVQRNESEEDRISIGFNLKFR